MENEFFIRLDVDNVGDAIELALINNNVEKAKEIHKRIQKNILELVSIIKKENNIILMVGCDDILFSTSENNFKKEFLITLKNTFYNKTGFSLSIGVGLTLHEALINLQKAKLGGKNNIIFF
jgi:hypothetical protein